MKQLFAFILLIATGLLLLTVLSGMSGLFSAIVASWSATNTTMVASTFTSILFYAGVVTVSVLGFALFNATIKGRIFSGRSQQSQVDYTVIDGHAIPTNKTVRNLLEDSSNDFDDWYELSQDEQQVRNL